MRIQEVITESTARTLYHGTSKKWLPYILKWGLMPTVGDFVRKLYAAVQHHGIALEPAVYAADSWGISKCVSAMIHNITEQFPGEPITEKRFYQHAALVVLKRAETVFTRHSDTSRDQPISVEPQDYYSRTPVRVDFALTDQRLRRFLRSHGIDLAEWGILN